MATARIEEHPDNGNHPFIVKVKLNTGGEPWIACRTREGAELKRESWEREFSKMGY